MRVFPRLRVGSAFALTGVVTLACSPSIDMVAGGVMHVIGIMCLGIAAAFLIRGRLAQFLLSCAALAVRAFAPGTWPACLHTGR